MLSDPIQKAPFDTRGVAEAAPENFDAADYLRENLMTLASGMIITGSTPGQVMVVLRKEGCPDFLAREIERELRRTIQAAVRREAIQVILSHGMFVGGAVLVILLIGMLSQSAAGVLGVIFFFFGGTLVGRLLIGVYAYLTGEHPASFTPFEWRMWGWAGMVGVVLLLVVLDHLGKEHPTRDKNPSNFISLDPGTKQTPDEASVVRILNKAASGPLSPDDFEELESAIKRSRLNGQSRQIEPILGYLRKMFPMTQMLEGALSRCIRTGRENAKNCGFTPEEGRRLDNFIREGILNEKMANELSNQMRKISGFIQEGRLTQEKAAQILSGSQAKLTSLQQVLGVFDRADGKQQPSSDDVGLSEEMAQVSNRVEINCRVGDIASGKTPSGEEYYAFDCESVSGTRRVFFKGKANLKKGQDLIISGIERKRLQIGEFVFENVIDASD